MDVAAVTIDDLLHDVEPETDALALGCRANDAALEGIEQARNDLGGDGAVAILVGDRDRYRFGSAFAADGDARLGRTVGEGVADEIAQSLNDPIAVPCTIPRPERSEMMTLSGFEISISSTT